MLKQVLNYAKLLFRETDKLLVFLCFLLSLVGSLAVFSATHQTSDGSLSRDFKIMLLVSFAGIIIAFLVSIIDYDILKRLAPLIAGAAILLMLSLFVFGKSPDARADARSWLKFGPLYFQPSELLKIAFIISFTVHLDKVKKNLGEFKTFFFLIIHIAIPMLLIVVTGDMGSALIFGIMAIGMMFLAGVPMRFFLLIFAGVVAIAPILWFKIFSDTQRNRIMALIYRNIAETDPSYKKYAAILHQQRRAIEAMENGGILGSGFLKGEYTQNGKIPVCESDMIFSVICEETGFLGGLLVVVLFALLMIKIVRCGKISQNFSGNMLCYGVMLMLASQVIINIGMCTMLLPVIGITLPFISSGGSSILVTYVAIGIVLSVYRSSYGIKDDNKKKKIVYKLSK